MGARHGEHSGAEHLSLRGYPHWVNSHLFYNSEAEAGAQPERCRVIFYTGCSCTLGNRSIHW